MSETLSPTLLPSSPGAAEQPPLGRALVEATELFARHRLFGLIWLDRALVAQKSYGALADFVPIGQRVTDTVLPLMGLDDALTDLIAAPELPFEMPNVALVGVDGASPRLNMQVYWMPVRQQFLLFISKVLSTGELEIGLAQQVRARMIVEAELASQSTALAAVNAELTRANRDLSEFAYVISHDLKAPLRAMRYFAEDLERSLAGNSATAPTVYADQIRTQSRRMAQMLTDLLAYSKIGRRTDALDSIDTARLVQSIVASMPRSAGMSIATAGSWPVLDTYAAPLDLVLRNLIANAVTHHDRPADGHIVVTGRSGTDWLEISIADDGPGIAPEWHETIFQPFKTVGTSADTERSGIGLALVRRTLETVGGQLTLSSDPAVGRGATFTIKWPVLIAA
jgi:signal transduction histidine kinase